MGDGHLLTPLSRTILSIISLAVDNAKNAKKIILGFKSVVSF